MCNVMHHSCSTRSHTHTRLDSARPQNLFKDVGEEGQSFVKRLLCSGEEERPSADECKEDVWLKMDKLSMSKDTDTDTDTETDSFRDREGEGEGNGKQL